MSTAEPVVLREIRPEDLDAHFAQQLDPASVAMAAVPARQRADFDAHWARNLADPANVTRSVVAGDAVIGSAVSFVVAGRRMVGYWIAREHWGKGFASAALRALAGELEERPLWATVAAHNAASRRVLEKAGFRQAEERREDDGVHVLVFRLD